MNPRKGAQNHKNKLFVDMHTAVDMRDDPDENRPSLHRPPSKNRRKGKSDDDVLADDGSCADAMGADNRRGEGKPPRSAPS